VFFGPVYPTITREKIPEIINTFIENGAKEIMLDKFNLKPGVLPVLEKTFPNHKHLLKNDLYFKQVLNEAKKIGNKKNVKIVSAF